MAMKIRPPDFTKSKSYERYKLELMAWRGVTDIDKKKQGVAVALSLPEDDESGIREKVFDEVKLEDLQKDDGLDTLLAYFDKQLGKDELTDSLEKFEAFEDYEREKGQSIADYISKFDQRYNKLVKLKMTLPPAILAFKLLKKANISKAEKMLVLTGMDYSKKEELYDQAKRSLTKFKGEQGGGAESGSAAVAVKLEPALVVEEEEEALAAGYTSMRGRRRNWRGYGGRGRYNSGTSGQTGQASRGRGQRRLNPTGADGKTLLCNACGSYRHMMSNCPDSWENLSQVNIVKEDTCEKPEEKVVLFTGNMKSSMKQLSEDARNSAVLDSACSSTVCGQNWLDCYLGSLGPEDEQQVEKGPGDKVFKFGGGERLKSKASYTIPAVLAGQQVRIVTDVVDSDIPLLLSKDAMKRAKVKLDLENDTAEILGVDVALNHTASGHYCVSINRAGEVPVESVCAVKLDELDEREKYRAVLKLHRQFAHPSASKLKALLMDAGAWKEGLQDVLDSVYDRCELCKVYKKTPPRPAVALPMASRFNEKVAMDLKKWQNRWILHLVDMWSRFSVSVFIQRKKPCEVIDKIMMCWVGAGFGVMEAILSDNGGEFSSDEMREVCSILNVETYTTAAESPFQNGLCERNHAVIDSMLVKLEEQCPETSQEVLLCWANMAKNSLQMWNGFSSYQLVFGKNPNLPNILTDQPPSLEGTTTSGVLAKHLNSLHAARRAFIQSETDERIRRALRSKMRASEQVFENGERVYYKREGQEKWLGPGKVVFQDGRVIFVRHGGTFVRVSPNRLLKAGAEFLNGENESDNIELAKEQNKYCQQKDSCKRGEPAVEEILKPADTEEGQVGGMAIPVERDVDLKREDRVQYKVEPEDEWIDATVLSRAGKASGQYKDWYNVKEDGGIERSVDFGRVHSWRKMAEDEVNIVLIPKERHEDSDCIEAKQQELMKLNDFGTYKEVKDKGQFRLSTTWVLWKKDGEVRARLVARGFEDEGSYRKDSPTIGKSAMRVLLAVAASKEWRVKTTDIKSAFLQGKHMDREVYITPPKEAGVQDGVIWQLNHCLYGLNDAARHFYQSVEEVLRDQGCLQSSLDPALFLKRQNGELVGMIAIHVDDFLHAGTEEFDCVMNKLRERFLAGRIDEGQFRYVGFDLKQRGVEGIVMDQTSYMESLENGIIDPGRAVFKQDLLSELEQTTLRQLVGRLNWAVQGSRPDMAFEMVELSTKLKEGTVGDLIRAIKAIRKLKEQQASVMFPNLGGGKGGR